MNSLSPRERKIALYVLLIGGAALLYQFVIDPYLIKRQELATSITQREAELGKAEKTFKDEVRFQRILNDLNAGGLKADVPSAESQLVHALGGWTKESGLTFTSIKPERAKPEGRWMQINTNASGSGSQSAVAKLLWRLETTTIPIRISDMTITSRKEGLDDLQLQLGVSTLCPNPEPEKPEPARKTVASARE